MAGRGRGERAEKMPRKPAPLGRKPDSAPLMGEPGWIETSAEWAPYPDGEKRRIPMPRGRGVRWLVACPRCRRWVKTLYQPETEWLSWACRICNGLHYESQYTGRRPACDPERMMRLLDSGIRAKKRGNERLAQRRAERFITALDTYQQRMDAYEMAELEREERLLKRDLARIDRQEARWQRRQQLDRTN